MRSIHPSPLLRIALRLDAAGSGAMALLQLALGARLASWTQLPDALLFETGLFLVVYVGLLLVLARAPRLPVALVGLVMIGNLGWAAAAVAIVPWLAPSAIGIAFVATHAVAVLVFAALQFAGLRASAPGGRDALAAA